MADKYILMNSSGPKKGIRNLGIVELEDGFSGTPAYLTPKARGISRVMKVAKNCYVGKTERSAGFKILAWFNKWTDLANHNERLWEDDLLVAVIDAETVKAMGFGLKQHQINRVEIVPSDAHETFRIYNSGENFTDR